jgi:GDSL-like Lipase/Acylhydrolase family
MPINVTNPTQTVIIEVATVVGPKGDKGDPGNGTGTSTPAPVQSVQGKIGAVVLTPSDIGAADATHTHPIATATVDGLLSKTDKAKLDGLSNSPVINPVTTTVNGLMLSTDKTKLDGIAVNATANATDAILKDRANHTGVQAISTVTGLQTALDTKYVKATTGIPATDLDTTLFPANAILQALANGSPSEVASIQNIIGGYGAVARKSVPTVGTLGDSISQNHYQDPNLGGMVSRTILSQFAFVAWASWLSGGTVRANPLSMEGYSGQRTDQILVSALGANSMTDMGRQISLTSNCSITTGSNVITTSGVITQAGVGMYVTGTGIPVNSTIVSIQSATQFTISNVATATNATASLILGDKKPNGIQANTPNITVVIAGTNDMNQATYAEHASGVAMQRCVAGLRALWAYVRACGSTPIAVSLFPGNGTWAYTPNTTATVTEQRAYKPLWNAAIKAAAITDNVSYFDAYAVCGNSDGSWKTGFIEGGYAGGPFFGNLVGEDPFGMHPGLNSMRPLGMALAPILAVMAGASPKVPRLYPSATAIYNAPYVADARGGYANFVNGILASTLSNISFDYNPQGDGVVAISTPTMDISGGGTIKISKPSSATSGGFARCMVGTPLTVSAGQTYVFFADIRAVQADSNTTYAVYIADGTAGGTTNQPIAQWSFTGSQSRAAVDTGILRVMVSYTVPTGCTSIKAYAQIGQGAGTVGNTDALYVANFGQLRLS